MQVNLLTFAGLFNLETRQGDFDLEDVLFQQQLSRCSRLLGSFPSARDSQSIVGFWHEEHKHMKILLEKKHLD